MKLKFYFLHNFKYFELMDQIQIVSLGTFYQHQIQMIIILIHFIHLLRKFFRNLHLLVLIDHFLIIQ